MTFFEKLLINHVKGPRTVLDSEIPISNYIPIDLSIFNKELELLDVSNPNICQEYIDKVVNHNSHKIAYGGYLERRNLYKKSPGFVGKGDEERNIHLGIDFWATAGTKVIAPLDGVVHSFKNNAASGDYGPTIILKHEFQKEQFYTLYGHLSIESLHGLHKNKEFNAGDVIAALGETSINVNYAPHLHFQIIKDLGDHMGDYPGVSSQKDLTGYQKNCPDPNLLLKITPPFLD